MSNKEILALNVGSLASKGFIFLWVLSSQVDTGVEALQKWGYKLIDSIVWIKTRGQNISVSHGFYFLHSTETCLVGYKNEEGNRKLPPDIPKISTNLIVSDIREKSRKPDELYEIIEMMFPWAKKLEIFARNHNLRKGWLSLGNQLGQQYKTWKQELVCDVCKQSIPVGKPRYKAKFRSNHDLCEKCALFSIQNNIQELKPESSKIENQKRDVQEQEDLIGANSPLIETEQKVKTRKIESSQKSQQKGKKSPKKGKKRGKQGGGLDFDDILSLEDEMNSPTEGPLSKQTLEQKQATQRLLQEFFYRIENIIEDEVFHNYRVCNECKCDPIWGVLFRCLECQDFDFCETCYDNDLKKENPHCKKHQFGFFQFPELGHGMPVHTGYQCCLCFQNPILGPMILCQKCNPFNTCYCQNCFLNKQMVYVRGHKESHEYKIVLHREEQNASEVKCAVCNNPIELLLRFRCLDCYDFNLCPQCYAHRRNDKPKYSSEHKQYHRFEKLYYEQHHKLSDHEYDEEEMSRGLN